MTAASGGIIGATQGQTLNLLSGVQDTAGASLALATNTAGAPIVTVGVVSGNYSPTAVQYTVSPTGTLSIDPGQFKSVAPGTTVTLGFNYTIVDSAGSKSPQTALLTVDGGSAVSYGVQGAVLVGDKPVTVTPTITSPEGGDSFAIDPPGAVLVTQAGVYGTATINTQSGVIEYSPSAGPGHAGTDTFTVSDTDSAGITTTTSVSFAVDGGTAVSYAPLVAANGVVTDAPTLVSPEGGDSFTFSGSAGSSTSETGGHGTASIDPKSGVITYTPSAPPGAAGVDTFTVSDTDALGVTTTTTASFSADGGTALSYAATFAGNSAATDTPTLTSPEGGDSFAFSGAGGLSNTETGVYGTASINAKTGVIAYASSAAPGVAGTDTFTVSDTDALAVTTAATANFTADGGTAGELCGGRRRPGQRNRHACAGLARGRRQLRFPQAPPDCRLARAALTGPPRSIRNPASSSIRRRRRRGRRARIRSPSPTPTRWA